MKALIAVITIVAVQLLTQPANVAAPSEAIASGKNIDLGQNAASIRRVSQYCVPEDNPDAHSFYCRNWQLIPMGAQDRILS
jgi:hypothetical protein